jgi:hypothetical protein
MQMDDDIVLKVLLFVGAGGARKNFAEKVKSKILLFGIPDVGLTDWLK